MRVMSQQALARRPLLLAAGLAALTGLPAAPALASSRRTLPDMTDGPFYPPARWRERGPLAGDWDADLTRVERGGTLARARGEYLGLQAVVADDQGRLIDGAQVEFWQCDALQHYTHPDVARTTGRFDPGFQGFGTVRSARDGTLSLRTIRPVAYPGRTPHIHVKLRHASFGELTTQLFVAGEPGNERDFLWRRLAADAQALVAMSLQPAPAGGGVQWLARQALVVPS
jgi:protocatechuate 3,4-dioxygenase, beta subunit